MSSVIYCDTKRTLFPCPFPLPAIPGELPLFSGQQQLVRLAVLGGLSGGISRSAWPGCAVVFCHMGHRAWAVTPKVCQQQPWVPKLSWTPLMPHQRTICPGTAGRCTVSVWTRFLPCCQQRKFRDYWTFLKIHINRKMGYCHILELLKVFYITQLLPSSLLISEGCVFSFHSFPFPLPPRQKQGCTWSVSLSSCW